MESFPSSFSFSNASARYKANALSFNEELAKGRKYICERYEKFLAAGKEYYTVNLIEYTGPVKTALICELFEKFPHIGYKGKAIDEVRQQTTPPTFGSFRSTTSSTFGSSDPLQLFENIFGPSPFTASLSRPTTAVSSESMQNTKPARHKIIKMSQNKLETHHDEYVIAITQNFANTMATGTW